ncbi:MAG: methyltransferase RsmF C-terminal domain-like protein [Candidatus Freyarchaeota archaeon]
MPQTDVTEEISKIVLEQFGARVGFRFKEMGKGKIYAYKECKVLEDKPIDATHYGVYFGRLEKDGLRLTIEGAQLIGETAKKNVIELDYDEAVKWMRGEDFQLESEYQGYVVLKWKNYFLGCGKLKNGVVKNFVPKDRRIID